MAVEKSCLTCGACRPPTQARTASGRPRSGRVRTCRQCGLTFVGFANRQRCHACKPDRVPVPRTIDSACKACGVTFQQPAGQHRRQAFCSDACRYGRRHKLTCKQCGKSYPKINRIGRSRACCSPECLALYRAFKQSLKPPRHVCVSCGGSAYRPGIRCRACRAVPESIVCPGCGAAFSPRRNSTEYCSVSCVFKAKRTPAINAVCLGCGTEFARKSRGQASVANGTDVYKYCCRQCAFDDPDRFNTVSRKAVRAVKEERRQAKLRRICVDCSCSFNRSRLDNRTMRCANCVARHRRTQWFRQYWRARGIRDPKLLDAMCLVSLARSKSREMDRRPVL